MGVNSDQITQPYKQELPGSQGYNRLLGGNLGAGGQAQNAAPPTGQGNPQNGPFQRPNEPLQQPNGPLTPVGQGNRQPFAVPPISIQGLSGLFGGFGGGKPGKF